MKKIAITTLLLICTQLVFTGCSTWGSGGPGIPVEITTEYHDNSDNGFVLVAGPGGIAVPEARYASVKTGARYEITATGGFLVTAPDGKTKIRIKRVEE